MNLRQPTSREKLLLGILTATALCALAYTLVFSSMIQSWSVVNDSISIAEKQLKKNLAIIHRRDIIEYEFDNLVARKTTGAADRSETSDWLKEIERVAGNRVWLQNLSPRPDRSMGSFVIQTTEVELRGTLLGIAQFLYEILHSPMLLRIDQMRLSVGSSDSDDMKCHLVISRMKGL